MFQLARHIRTLSLLLLPVFCSPAMAAKYTLQNRQDSVIGEVLTVQTQMRDTLLDIARRNGLGYHDIKLLNPDLDTWLPGEDKEVKLPLKFILPKAERRGIVLNIPEMRLYFFPGKDNRGVEEVFTYPLGVGRQGWSTPYVKTRIIEKKKNPKWYPPESIRQEHEEAGDPLPKIVEPGPDNPLGDHALRLGLPEYLIHGTNKPFGIGMRVSHGCIRLYPEDIAELYDKVPLGTHVEIINQPYKIGELDGVLYLEAHPFLDEDAGHYDNNLTPVVKLIVEATGEQNFEIDWDLVRDVARNPAGVPVAIGIRKIESVIAAAEPEAEATPAPGPVVEPDAAASPVEAPPAQTGSVIDEAISSQQQKLKLRLDTSITPLKYYR